MTDLTRAIEDEISRLEREMEDCKHEARRHLDDRDKCQQIEERMRAIHIRLDELRANLDKEDG